MKAEATLPEAEGLAEVALAVPVVRPDTAALKAVPVARKPLVGLVALAAKVHRLAVLGQTDGVFTAVLVE